VLWCVVCDWMMRAGTGYTGAKIRDCVRWTLHGYGAEHGTGTIRWTAESCALYAMKSSCAS